MGSDEQIKALAITHRVGDPVAVCATWRGGAYVLDLKDRDRIGHWTDVGYLSSCAAGDLNGKPVVALGSEGNGSGVLLADAQTGQPATPSHPPAGVQVTSVAITSHEGRTLVVSGARDRTLRTWEPATPDALHVTQVDGDVTHLAVTELDGYPVAVCGGPSGEVRLVDLITRSSARAAIPPVTCMAVSGERLICGTERGIRLFDLRTGAPLPAPDIGIRRVGRVTTGTLHNRPIALAAERYGSLGYAWYVDTGDLVTSVHVQTRAIESIALARHRGGTLAIFGTFDQTVIIKDLDSDEPPVEKDGYHGRISDIAMITMADVPVLVASEVGTIRTRYLHEEDRPSWPDGDETPMQPLGMPLAGSPLTGSADKIAALAFADLAGRPVLASGALDGTVRVWNLSDISTPITIATLAGVNAIALAEPDLCIIGTNKGLLTIRLNFPDGKAGVMPVRMPHDIRADRVCPYHDTHEHPAGVPGSLAVPTMCVKGVQFTIRPWQKRRPPLVMPNAHCYLQDGHLLVISGDEQLRYSLSEITVNSYNEPLGHWHDGCHFGIGVRVPSRTFALACYRRGERDRLVQMIVENGGSAYESRP